MLHRQSEIFPRLAISEHLKPIHATKSKIETNKKEFDKMALSNTEQKLFKEISTLIEQTRCTVFQYASNTPITLF
ncbi:MAG: hypothetical protein LBQ98_01070 [Nitrososphaerota archaeon]|nr:hypothetical protein [Nitrososphaerota archaeon]